MVHSHSFEGPVLLSLFIGDFGGLRSNGLASVKVGYFSWTFKNRDFPTFKTSLQHTYILSIFSTCNYFMMGMEILLLRTIFHPCKSGLCRFGCRSPQGGHAFIRIQKGHHWDLREQRYMIFIALTTTVSRRFWEIFYITLLLFSISVMSDSLWPHELQQARLQSLLRLISIELVMPSNHLILCWPLLLCLQSFPASGSFQRSQFFTSGGQSIGVSASASVLPMNTQD